MKGIMLLSGGFDSPVALHMLKQEHDMILLHLSNEKYAGKESIEKTKNMTKQLGFKKLILIDLSKTLEEIAQKCDHKYYFVISKRAMMRTAEQLATQEKADFIGTGECVAQVSSQTLDNLAAIDKSTKLPIVRPLLGFDKHEIIELAKKIGTHDFSIGPEMCDILGPRHPSTKVNYKKVLKEEAKININALILDAIQNKQILTV